MDFIETLQMGISKGQSCKDENQLHYNRSKNGSDSSR
jgi:hypothetical protein